MFYIRADGNSKTGAGHIMRMMSLAKELKEFLPVTFLCMEDMTQRLLGDNGYESIRIPGGLFPFSGEEGRYICDSILDKDGKDCVLVDSYLPTDEYLLALKAGCTLMIMDDTADRVYPSDVVINYNFHADRERYDRLYKGTDRPGFVLGPSYMIIRDEFKDKRIKIREKVTDILVTVGGSDEYDLCGSILKAISERMDKGLFADVTIHAVCGLYNAHYEKLIEVYGQDVRFDIRKNVKDMAALMSQCDIAASAGGATLNELGSMGIPTVCFAYADNQRICTESLKDRDAVIYAGMFDISEGAPEDIKTAFADGIADELLRLCDDPGSRQRISGRFADLLHVNGTLNLAKTLASFSRMK